MKLIELRHFFNNQLVNKSIKVLFLRVFGVGLFFLITLFLTNYFDSKLVGQYDFSRSLLLFFGGICVFGMHQSIIYYSGYLAAQNAIDNLKLIYRKMLVIVLFISILIVSIFYFINDESINLFFEKDVANIVIKTTIALFFYGITMLNIDVFRAIKKIYISELYRNIIRYLPFFLAVLFIFLTNKNNLLVDVFLFNFLFLGVLTTIILLIYFSKIKVAKSEIEISYSSIIKRSGPMAISAIAYILMQSVDIILLSKFTDFSNVAFYAVAIKLTTMISLVLASVNTVQAPKIAEYYSSNNHQKLDESIKKATRLIFMLTFPAILLLAIFSGFILKLFGPEYPSAQNALFILLIGQSINALCGSVGVYMNMTGKQNVLQKVLVIAFILNLSLNWILIPLYGFNGAAFATSLSMIFWNVTAVVYIYKKDKIQTFFTFR